MTLEKRIIIGLVDIKVISYECKKCGARTTFSPDKILEPNYQCFSCQNPWRPRINEADFISPQKTLAQESVFNRLLEAIGYLRNPEVSKTHGFRVLFEVEEAAK